MKHIDRITEMIENYNEEFHSHQPQGHPTTYNKTAPLKTNPHYSDGRFKKPQTIFGKPANDQYGHPHLSYDYSDRLWQWDHDKSDKAAAVANESGHGKRSCLWAEAYLSAYYDCNVTIEHIIAGVNHSNGYSYLVYGYTKE